MTVKLFKHELRQGDIISNDKLCTLFKVSSQGGMRRSLRTNSLILVSNVIGSEYENRWENGELHYTGMGLLGDQNLNFSQNKTLLNHLRLNVSLFLFEKFKSDRYMYQDEVSLSSKPYQMVQLGGDKKPRKVWIFPLKLKGEKQFPISKGLIIKNREKKEKRAANLSDEELYRRAKNNSGEPSTRETISTVFERDPYIVELCLRRAGGVCELCSQPAPFKKKNGEPYLECHHIEWLSEGGPDTIENTVALCPNCHRKMHSRNDKKDRDFLLLTAIRH